MLKLFGIDEEADEILYNERITMERGDIVEILHHIMDFPVLTKSGKILLFEFKKDMPRRADVKQLYKYFIKLHCDEAREIIPILLTIPKNGNIESYSTPLCPFYSSCFEK